MDLGQKGFIEDLVSAVQNALCANLIAARVLRFAVVPRASGRLSGQEMADLHVDQTAIPRKRLVLTRMRAAKPRAGRVVPVLVHEDTVEHQELFA